MAHPTLSGYEHRIGPRGLPARRKHLVRLRVGSGAGAGLSGTRSVVRTKTGQGGVIRATLACDSNEPFEEENMKSALTVLFLVLSATAGFAQQGISNKRDVNGNLVRDTGLNPPRRPLANNFNGQVNQAPSAPRTSTSPGTVAPK
jgi:hypothetical protein